MQQSPSPLLHADFMVCLSEEMSENTNEAAQTAYSYELEENREPYATNPAEMLSLHELPDIARALSRLLILFVLLMIIFMITIPWQQTSSGTGKVIAYLPNERTQNIHATVSGRIKQWFVREGTYLNKGDPILELIDTDPRFFERLNIEKDALKRQYEAAMGVTRTAKYDVDRQTDLFHKGISARKDMEHAIIAYKSAQASEAQAFANLTQAESRVSRQQTQVITAPMDGTVVRLTMGTSSVLVEQGQVVAVFVPRSDHLAVEISIPGKDLPLINEGRKVRLQFEGWPAIQFSGWPSIAVGTFGGVVAMLDQVATPEGLFRVIVIPEPGEKWPENRFIRQGARANGWVLLNQVALGYELWRQFNGFPPSMDKPPESPGTPNLSMQ